MSTDDGSIGRLFQACDLDGSGYIDEDELARICGELSPEEIKEVFAELDKDGDGRISSSEFSEGFRGIQDNLLGESEKRREKRRLSCLDIPLKTEEDAADPGEGNVQVEIRARPGRRTLRKKRGSEGLEGTLDEAGIQGKVKEIVGNLDEGFGALSCQEQVCELYQSLHGTQMPEVLSQFEDIVLGVIKDIRQQQFENERLEKSLKREKERHMEHLRQLEEETEAQVQKMEARIRQQEHVKADHEKAEIKAKMEREVAELNASLKKLQKLESDIESQDKPSEEIKSRLEETVYENRHLRSNLTDAQTSLAVMRSEIATLRQLYEEKCYELEMEKDAAGDVSSQHDTLVRHVSVLHDANKQLHDTNDDLRSALDTTRHSQRRLNHSNRSRSPSIRSTPSSMHSTHSARDGYVQEYLNSSVNSLNTTPLADELRPLDTPVRRLMSAPHDSGDGDSLPDDIDSGHSTMRDHLDVESEYGPPSVDDEPSYIPRQRRRNRKLRNGFNSGAECTTESDMPESDHDDMYQPIPLVLDGEAMGSDLELRGLNKLSRSSSRACSVCSHDSIHSHRGSRQRMSSPVAPPPVITKDPERMYKVVLAGDAAVGKSSFIMRLCKNKFITNLNSTLGVDFQTKVLDVDSRIVALQLWDTAGQERFRSIAKSYFRRADGVILVYDCTYERSFLSIREWIDTVEEGSEQKLPIMIVANKTDLRSDSEADGKRCVTYEEGKRLARDNDALFIETSAKNGHNIYEAVTELARLLRTAEDLEVRNVGMKLHDLSTEKSTSKIPCCSN